MDASPKPSRWPLVLVSLVAIIAIGGMISIRNNLVKTRTEQDVIFKENVKLKLELSHTQAQVDELKPLVEALKEEVDTKFHGTEAEKLRLLARRMEKSGPNGTTARTAAPNPKPPEKKANTLVPGEVTVVPLDDGYIANVGFTPTTEDPLGMLALIIRVPKGTSAEITGLTPLDDSTLDNVQVRVDKTGKHAVLYATPNQVAELKFAVSVSEETTATISGTCGIGAFDVKMGR